MRFDNDGLDPDPAVMWIVSVVYDGPYERTNGQIAENVACGKVYRFPTKHDAARFAGVLHSSNDWLPAGADVSTLAISEPTAVLSRRT
jgi:hypothetical protein